MVLLLQTDLAIAAASLIGRAIDDHDMQRVLEFLKVYRMVLLLQTLLLLLFRFKAEIGISLCTLNRLYTLTYILLYE
jgi:Ca2+/Na+ antiporter